MPRFQPGKSGNPAGRPPGTRDRRSAVRDLLETRQAELVQKAVDLALAGDTTALKLCLDRCMAPLRARDTAVRVAVTGETLGDRGEAVLTQLSEGAVTVSEASALLHALASLAELVEFDDLHRRIAALEERAGSGPS